MAITPAQLLDWKRQQRPIVALTAWDTAIASVLDGAGVEIILVGDSLGMVALGYDTTLPVSLDTMIHHAGAVKRGVQRALVVCDLPFLTYQESPTQAIRSAGRILQEAGAQAVKLEGGHPRLVETVGRLTEIGIPVMGHVGLTPQSVHQLGYRRQGQDALGADRIRQQAIALAEAGVFAVVLEHIPGELAASITEQLAIPTIGIGAGPHCDGQVLVTADLLGLTVKQPPFAPAYVDLRRTITETVRKFSGEVRQRQFPRQD
ncbi:MULTISPECIES: 3-methyl-2-oxobutanoate hydroxymethyltransferase [unclassified Synechocystis]|uniref:3-methyl-2-oxobutanoate hydroxymethyltransferase n=1 Tax=unclassified Synechocystis TaxID=2640012 RepID=UPI0003F7FE51|nr:MULTISPECIES: 3-methyl-2-oxobutanoate hydroxymethyltransferase [unclassified Synechocystis]AIE75193.1 3-methyl-2-oxobutanoate hydroxymethyltransferase [Synechocystis sp. PCC 6714]MCT0252953.1 3-methyl-2-oxobutanoate hydroxymethyltransferase [Synechocystis sp. CS-94]